ncbi:UxaA family hydrolase [Prauserella muralis]|uniref:Altronate hydrolase n=1 Tax=Prauserella muralis TaxID=588067 RepID=A0A2V4ARL1_9PSEU|nr:UxaA family hydrolase [Prauserella muralis]PXY22664.1 altronate hydrolase [Prauserella muralis]TWE28375.1 altronate dehydratase [Prauserella muralis]
MTEGKQPVRFGFGEVAVLPEPGDNAAIASRSLAEGSSIELGERTLTLRHAVPEGHRFVVRAVEQGAPLLSWSTPFARALRDLRPGDYVCTARSLDVLRSRGVSGLPSEPSAEDVPLEPYRLEESALRLGEQIDPVAVPATFRGFAREHGPAGTRNHVVVVGTTSRSGAFVTELARRFSGAAGAGLDGVVPVAHTEGGEDHAPNNLAFLLSALAGFLVHPNVGAVLVVDEPGSPVTGEHLREYLRAHGYPPLPPMHAFFTRRGSFADDLAAAAGVVAGWLEPMAAQARTERPVADLRIALQCGGSDAFSGITANPLAGAVAREVIRHGGAAVLAETDELIGAEGYVLENVRTADVARRFLAAIASFTERVGRHGHTAEGNPSGGNLYRGLYNIVLKSVGAARKRDRGLRLDDVIGYGEPLAGPGFTFMDSPGNDLESVAGEVAAGCNLIFFTTGNGSITNFPFVPTLKFVTTTPRYRLLRHEMDVDAGRFLTGTPMAELTAEVFAQTVRAASGEPTAGERAGHSQVSIWRDWKQTRPRTPVAVSLAAPAVSDDERDAPLPGIPIPVSTPDDGTRPVRLLAADGRAVPEHVALVLPTSLCSGQVALRIAERAGQQDWLGDTVSRVVALPHTEGCGASSGASEETYARIMLGCLTHPHVRFALLLEHGCEKTHNDYFRSRLVEAGADPARFGWAGIQRDGGIAAVTERVRAWFADAAAGLTAPVPVTGDLGSLAVGLEARGALTAATARALAETGHRIVAAGGTVLLSSRGGLLADETFRRAAFGAAQPVRPTLAHGQRPSAPGWHVMRAPSTDWLETATGLGACGAQLVLAHVAGGALTSPRLVPLVQVSAEADTLNRHGGDLDAALGGDAGTQARQVLDALVAVASGERHSRALAAGNVGFQVTRGLLGTSM